MRKAILFDLDDTLTDRRASIARYARRFGIDFRDRLAGDDTSKVLTVINDADGRGYAPRREVFSALQRALPWRLVPELSRLAEHWETWFPTETAGCDGLLQTLEELLVRGFLLGVVTNGRAMIQQAKIDRLGIRTLLTSVVISEAVGCEKPNTRIFEMALGDVGCARGEVWFVGDHPENDVIGAAGAGLEPIWLKGRHPWPTGTPLPRHHIDRLTDVIVAVCEKETSAK